VLKYTRTLVIGMTIAAALPASTVLAHHGANLYDMTKALELKGTVTKFYWGNPHNEIAIDVTDAQGKVAQWVAYTEPPLVMLETGWTRRSIPVGEKVTMYVFPAKNGSTVATLSKIVLANGTELIGYGAPRPAPPAPAK